MRGMRGCYNERGKKISTWKQWREDETFCLFVFSWYFVMFYFRDLVFVYMCFVINLLKCENRKHCGGGGEELYFCFAFEHII